MEERIIKDINDLLAKLFKKMKEAGYEWNAEKKELKKIEQKPAWSEEDEKMLNFLIDVLLGTPSARFIPIKREIIITWLKSLKERHTWKPSDAQMHALKLAIGDANYIDTAAGDEAAEILTSLYDQLEKLKQK